MPRHLVHRLQAVALRTGRPTSFPLLPGLIFPLILACGTPSKQAASETADSRRRAPQPPPRHVSRHLQPALDSLLAQGRHAEVALAVRALRDRKEDTPQLTLLDGARLLAQDSLPKAIDSLRAGLVRLHPPGSPLPMERSLYTSEAILATAFHASGLFDSAVYHCRQSHALTAGHLPDWPMLFEDNVRSWNQVGRPDQARRAAQMREDVRDLLSRSRKPADTTRWTTDKPQQLWLALQANLLQRARELDAQTPEPDASRDEVRARSASLRQVHSWVGRHPPPKAAGTGPTSSAPVRPRPRRAPPGATLHPS